MGADGGIGGTYAVMPELYLAIYKFVNAGEIAKAREVQYEADRIIYAMCACNGNLYAVMKEILRQNNNIHIGSVRSPLPALTADDIPKVSACAKMIQAAIHKVKTI
ncbi:MAG: dihydrodipicolinate synthase family protein, partial [Ruthenibacterium sp.]